MDTIKKLWSVMNKHIKTNFKLFILERINDNTKKFTKNDRDLEEIEPDDLEITDTEEESAEDDISIEFDRIMDDDDKDDDDLIEELYRKYKTLQRQYENRLHKRKSRKTIR